ncbi:ABC transporter ATP-binding protein [Piscinibacter terrae]|uniref:ABC transporter ATP-binding protein n=1 Tax=Piscinibacter terrae TaxID=2496871 RepID=A0A3N7HQA6_9BURK|nr:ABC transporter ATP-binding protein [Albitalea terrae]RQP22951.1 ABC transporter ATP-binding protein [Albitalea terrae]
MPALISLKDVHKQFATGVVALQQVSIEVAEQEFVSLLGPSGCGKSTILRLVAGLDRPSSGQIMSPAMTSAADTAFVFQDATLMPWASVFDNVWLPLRLDGESRSASEARVLDALARVGLKGFEKAFPAELSGGMRMRASIARALVTRPRVMLMDEPFAALDEFTRHKLNDDLLACWQAQRFATLFVTHSVLESVFLSQRVLVMGPRPGRVVAEVVIDEPYPRSASFRESPRYHAACAQLNLALASLHAPVDQVVR